MLVLAGDDWEVWIDWYEDRLAGYDADPEIELARVMLPEEFWKQGPKAVNAEIKRLIEEARRGSPELPAEPIPAQGAGPHFAFAPNGKIALAPATEIDADGNHIGRMRQLLPIARRAADRLITHLGSTNAYVELAQDVRDYRAAIDGEPERIAWGIVFGLGVMLENATEAARRAIEDRLKPALEDPAQSALDSLLSLHGPLILASAEGRELADDANQMHQTRDEQARLRADVQVVARGLKGAAEIVEPPAADIVGKAADAIGGGRHPERGTVFGIATIGNVTIGLVGVAAASLLLGAPVVASAVGAGVTLIGVEAVKKSEKFSSLTSMLGQNIDRVLGLGGAYRRFVIANQEPLRRIAMDTQQLRWMLPHIDRIVESEAAEQHDGREE